MVIELDLGRGAYEIDNSEAKNGREIAWFLNWVGETYIKHFDLTEGFHGEITEGGSGKGVGKYHVE